MKASSSHEVAAADNTQKRRRRRGEGQLITNEYQVASTLMVLNDVPVKPFLLLLLPLPILLTSLDVLHADQGDIALLSPLLSFSL